MTADIGMIRQTLTLLHTPGTVAELRIINAGRVGTVSGYFDAIDVMTKEAAQWSGEAPGVYSTLNPCTPALLARAANRLITHAKQTTRDADIVRRHWLPIDFDPVRPAGISSTAAEHESACQRAHACRAVPSAWQELGWRQAMEPSGGG